MSESDAAREMEELLATARSADDRGAPFLIDGTRLTPKRVVEILRPMMRPARLARIEAVAAGRTNTVVPVVEGLVNTGNVSAIMRSAEALGYQSFHAIEGAHDRFKHSERTSRGAEKWLDLYRWAAPGPCVDYLHAGGYRVVAMHLGEDGVPIETLDFTVPTALVFGNEERGVSPALLATADQCCIVPLSGFTESFNVSVAAAVALYHARRDRLRRQGYHADLSAEEQRALVARLCMRSVRHAEHILRRALHASDAESFPDE